MNKERIAVLTDTGSYLSLKEANDLGIYLLPLQIIEKIDGQLVSHLDLIDVKTHDVYSKLYNGTELKTSLPKLSSIYELMLRIKDEGYDSVIAIPLTLGISSTVSNIYAVANEIDLPISIIDTYTTCQIQNYIVKEVKQLVDKNYSREEIVSLIEKQIKGSNSIILAKDINHLKKGGRITPAAAAFANMMKIFPILTMNHTTVGKIDVLDKVRTERKAKHILIEETIKHMNHDNYEVYVIHSDDLENAQSLKEELVNGGVNETNVHIADFSSVISVHVGMKCLAIQTIEKLNLESECK